MKPTFYIDSEIKDIKVGQKYNFTLLAIQDKTEHMDALFESPTGMRYYIKQNDYVALSPENGTKNTETAPKYDPCREFREGDKVRVRKIHGKLPQCRYNGMIKVKEGDCCTIDEKEHRNCYWVTIPSGGNWCWDAVYLELVTPVEEMRLYKVNHDKELELFEVCHYEMGDDTIEKEGELYKIVRTIYWYGNKKGDRTEEEALAEAEAECARLNAEASRTCAFCKHLEYIADVNQHYCMLKKINVYPENEACKKTESYT